MFLYSDTKEISVTFCVERVDLEFVKRKSRMFEKINSQPSYTLIINDFEALNDVVVCVEVLDV